jgi:DNA-binding response OmpR family regulator
VSKPGRRTRTVLCIGSEAISLHRRCSFLREQGWRVLSSANGHEGILRCTVELVDVVVIDLNSDGSEGALIAGELKRLRPKVPVIILVTEGETLVEGALASADAVVRRSDHHRELLKALEAALGAP